METGIVKSATHCVAIVRHEVIDLEKELKEWKAENKQYTGEEPRYQAIVDRLKDANEELKNARRHLEAMADAFKPEPREIDFPLFDPSDYEVSFPLLEAKNGEMFLTMLDRDDVVKEINDSVQYVPTNMMVHNPMYSPIIITSSRGMGKTFLLKMIGMQKVKPELKCPLIEQAMACGRILSFDFHQGATAVRNDSDVGTFFTRLMIHYLCRMFENKQVDGINFEYIEFDRVKEFRGKQHTFNRWKRQYLAFGADGMIDEYIRLTNIAFYGEHDEEYCAVPPVFLLDEVQHLCTPTDITSTFSTDGTPKTHTLLSWLLTQLGGLHHPVCICAGLNNGNLVEMSSIMPEVLSLTPLVNDYWQHWTELTNYRNRECNSHIEVDGDEELIHALVYASYQIPRLLGIAHQTWFDVRQSGINDRQHFIKAFELETSKYYEMGSFLREYSIEDIPRIILSCGVHWRVGDVNRDKVP